MSSHPRSPSPSPSPATPPSGTSGAASPQASPRPRAFASLAALRTGVTAFAVMAGLACYFVLAQIGVTGIPAAVAGLVFALLVRVAALSLLRDWLLAAARRRMPPPSTPPSRTPPAPRR